MEYRYTLKLQVNLGLTYFWFWLKIHHTKILPVKLKVCNIPLSQSVSIYIIVITLNVVLNIL